MKKTLLNIAGLLMLLGLWAYQWRTTPHVQKPAVAHDNLIQIAPWYNWYNHRYFNDQLQTDLMFSWGKALTFDNDGGNPTENLAVTDGSLQHPITIQLNPKFMLSASQQQMTLLHEMCHVSTWQTDIKRDHKQGVWLDCMHDLAGKGAFDDLW